MRFETLTLEDFRGIRRLDLELPSDGPCVLLGENGAGKTSVLAGMAYALLGPVLPSSGHRSTWNVRANTPLARCRATVDGRRLATRIDDRRSAEVISSTHEVGTGDASVQDILFDDESPERFLAAYGAGRRVELGATFDPDLRNNQTGRRLQRVGSLLEPGFHLVPLDSWLPRHEKRFDEVADILARATEGDLRLSRKRSRQGEFLVEQAGSMLPLRALSDGYRAHLGWLADLLYHLALVAPGDLTSLEGVVLVDEVDLHLHPRWQRQVLGSLQEALPRLQLILTTHSPLVLGGVKAENVRRLRAEGDELLAEQPGIETLGLSPDQLLLSDLFGLESTRSPHFVDRLKQVEKQAATGDGRAAVRYQQMLTRGSAGDVEPLQAQAPDWLAEAARKDLDLELD